MGHTLSIHSSVDGMAASHLILHFNDPKWSTSSVFSVLYTVPVFTLYRSLEKGGADGESRRQSGQRSQIAQSVRYRVLIFFSSMALLILTLENPKPLTLPIHICESFWRGPFNHIDNFYLDSFLQLFLHSSLFKILLHLLRVHLCPLSSLISFYCPSAHGLSPILLW